MPKYFSIPSPVDLRFEQYRKLAEAQNKIDQAFYTWLNIPYGGKK